VHSFAGDSGLCAAEHAAHDAPAGVDVAGRVLPADDSRREAARGRDAAVSADEDEGVAGGVCRLRGACEREWRGRDERQSPRECAAYRAAGNRGGCDGGGGCHEEAGFGGVAQVVCFQLF